MITMQQSESPQSSYPYTTSQMQIAGTSQVSNQHYTYPQGGANPPFNPGYSHQSVQIAATGPSTQSSKLYIHHCIILASLTIVPCR